MVYGTSTVKDFNPSRKRWPDAWLEALDDQLIGLFEEDWPQSIRHCFYRLTNPRLPVYVPKTEIGYRRIQRRLTLLRRSGLLPYSHLVDTTRMGWHVPTYGSAGDFLKRVAGLYRHDIWQHAQAHVEVWCESASIGGVLKGTCPRTGRLAVPDPRFRFIDPDLRGCPGNQRGRTGPRRCDLCRRLRPGRWC